MLISAQQAVLESTRWLSASEVASLSGLDESPPVDQPSEWRRVGKIFAIHHNGSEYFPSYALDEQAGYRPLKVMSDILEAFSTTKDSWGVAFWFASANSFLGGKRPQDLLATHPDQVLAAAYDELLGVTHG
ncbi:hypothetical protein NG726_12630 [Pseudomonas sp. MOB-449]|nr:hypothetical protein [Pseudomonas sp. MOB-449]